MCVCVMAPHAPKYCARIVKIGGTLGIIQHTVVLALTMRQLYWLNAVSTHSVHSAVSRRYAVCFEFIHRCCVLEWPSILFL